MEGLLVVPLAYEKVRTVDNRIILNGALYWRDLPLSVILDGEKVGNIVELDRDVDGVIWASVDIDIPNTYCVDLNVHGSI